ncbi:MAG: biotin--[acetyl-CoA-carboxylase] ligase [Clostridia bacterium]|nr:biotin--[acetyl-CoA-carboxylase] ligase [Clostridia bacterium]
MSEIKSEVLKILTTADGPVSGEKLSGSLHVSRTAIWDAIRKLRSEGYAIEGTRGYGYILSGCDIVSAEGISRFWKGEKLPSITVLPSCVSTNDILKKAASEGLETGSSVLSREQQGGRGRYGRLFVSPRDKGLYLSVLLRPEKSWSEVPLLTVYVSVCVANVLEKLAGLPENSISVKWVNDLYLSGKKICGILTEGVMDMESNRLDHAVVGIGINLYPCTFPKELAAIATDLETQTGRHVDINELAAEIIRAVMEYTPESAHRSLENYRQRSFLIGQKVVIHPAGDRSHAGQKALEALVTGIGDAGELQVRTDDGRNMELRSGEVTLHKGGVS